MSAHTPGPWVIDVEMRAGDICTLHGMPRQPIKDGLEQGWVYIRAKDLNELYAGNRELRQDANARLIAAAPDLLEALRGVVRVADRATVEFDAARAAIAKATGATP